MSFGNMLFTHVHGRRKDESEKTKRRRRKDEKTKAKRRKRKDEKTKAKRRKDESEKTKRRKRKEEKTKTKAKRRKDESEKTKRRKRKDEKTKRRKRKDEKTKRRKRKDESEKTLNSGLHVFVISLFRLRYFVMSPSLFRYVAFVISSFRFRLFVFSLLSFRYGAFVMSPRNNEKTKWHKSATIHLQRVWHADRDAYSSGHLVPSLWDLHMFFLLRPILFRTCRYFIGLCSSMLLQYYMPT